MNTLKANSILLAELNTNWYLRLQDDRLKYRTRGWWESSNIQTSHNQHSYITQKQAGGTATLTINEYAHRSGDPCSDPRKLGRWTSIAIKGHHGVV